VSTATLQRETLQRGAVAYRECSEQVSTATLQRETLQLQAIPGNLSAKQQRAILALLSEPGIDAAARKAGVNPATLWRWQRQPHFREALEEPGAAPAFDADTVGRVFFAAERAVRGLQLPDAEEREEWALSDVVEALEDARGQPAAALLQQVAEAAYRRHLRLLIAVRQAEEDTASGKALALLPTESDLQKIARYESHLHRLLTSTLHELEALQARRRGEPAPLARLDVAGLPPGE